MSQPDPYSGQNPPPYPAPAPGAMPSVYPPSSPQGPSTNTLAIVSLIASISAFIVLPLLGSIAGVITGHISLSQIRRSGEQGRGLALGGLIVGYVGIGLAVIAIIGAALFFGFFLTAVSQSSYS